MSNTESIRALWQQCFHDEESFADLFFSRIFNPENTLTIERSGQLLAMLQMLPYTFTAWNAEWHCAYVAGVATAPEERNKGLMRGLLAEALLKMHGRHTPLSLLIPAESWLFNYYARMGYATVCRTQPTQIAVPASMPRGYHETIVSPDCQFAFYDKMNRARKAAVLHNKTDYEVILADHKLSGGNVHAIVAEDNALVALGLTIPCKDKILLKDFVAADACAGAALSYAISRHYGMENIVCNQPAATGSPRAMLRVTDVKAVLPAWAKCHPLTDLNVEITDCCIPANNTRWHIGNGKATPLSGSPDAILRLSIDRFTNLLFGLGNHAASHCIAPLCPYVTLMLD